MKLEEDVVALRADVARLQALIKAVLSVQRYAAYGNSDCSFDTIESNDSGEYVKFEDLRSALAEPKPTNFEAMEFTFKASGRREEISRLAVRFMENAAMLGVKSDTLFAEIQNDFFERPTQNGGREFFLTGTASFTVSGEVTNDVKESALIPHPTLPTP